MKINQLNILLKYSFYFVFKIKLNKISPIKINYYLLIPDTYKAIARAALCTIGSKIYQCCLRKSRKTMSSDRYFWIGFSKLQNSKKSRNAVGAGSPEAVNEVGIPRGGKNGVIRRRMIRQCKLAKFALQGLTYSPLQRFSVYYSKFGLFWNF